MNKAELVDKTAELTGHTKKSIELTLKTYADIISDELAKGGKVQMVGFGTFETRKRAARTGVNPQTKEKITIPASVAPVFKAGKALKEKVNK